jgi:hypothetical protein
MGQTSIYVFAQNDRPAFVQESLTRLSEAGVISSEPYGGKYGAGTVPWASGAFDYLGIHRSRLPFIIPQDPAIEPMCPGCGADVNEAFYETVNEIEDEGQEVDWSNVKVTCPHCHEDFPTTALKDRVGIFCAREYFYLSDVTVDDLPAFETELRKILHDAEIKTYWYT